MNQLVQLFKNSRVYMVMEPVSGEVAVDGFSTSSKRRLFTGMQLHLIGGKLVKEGYSFFKTGGVNAPIKIHNENRTNRKVVKVLALKCLVSGEFDCGTPFERGTDFFMLGGKSKNANLVTFRNGTKYVLTLTPQEVVGNFILNFDEVSELTVQERNFKNNMSSDYISHHFGKDTIGNRYK